MTWATFLTGLAAGPSALILFAFLLEFVRGIETRGEARESRRGRSS